MIIVVVKDGIRVGVFNCKSNNFRKLKRLIMAHYSVLDGSSKNIKLIIVNK